LPTLAVANVLDWPVFALYVVVCAARTQADIDAVADDVGRRGRRAIAVPTDVMKTEDLQKLLDATLAILRCDL
jgi:NADP-dependent 3-hydroxy acid dehydrogenase YdfG